MSHAVRRKLQRALTNVLVAGRELRTEYGKYIGEIPEWQRQLVKDLISVDAAYRQRHKLAPRTSYYILASPDAYRPLQDPWNPRKLSSRRSTRASIFSCLCVTMVSGASM